MVSLIDGHHHYKPVVTYDQSDNQEGEYKHRIEIMRNNEEEQGTILLTQQARLAGFD